MKATKELVEISKVYKDDEMNLTDKYQAVVNSVPYAKLYQNIVEVFPDLKMVMNIQTGTQEQLVGIMH